MTSQYLDASVRGRGDMLEKPVTSFGIHSASSISGTDPVPLSYTVDVTDPADEAFGLFESQICPVCNSLLVCYHCGKQIGANGNDLGFTERTCVTTVQPRMGSRAYAFDSSKERAVSETSLKSNDSFAAQDGIPLQLLDLGDSKSPRME